VAVIKEEDFERMEEEAVEFENENCGTCFNYSI